MELKKSKSGKTPTIKRTVIPESEFYDGAKWTRIEIDGKGLYAIETELEERLFKDWNEKLWLLN